MVLLVGLWMNSKKQFVTSKWIYVISVYSMGVLTTLLLGGSSLYHIQSLLIFESCLIIFDIKKEKLQILIGIPFVITCVAIGEFNIIPVPDFSHHWWNEIARIANISSMFFIGTLLISFILRLNAKNERDLNTALSELKANADELKASKENLEIIVDERTASLQEKQETLLKQNEEKAILLKEVHHRVKNNLQVIISLINFQLIKLDNKEVEVALKEIQNRIHSMSLVHQKMYQTSNFKSINLKNYTNDIIENISKIFNEDNFDHTINIPDDVIIDIERAIPTGLIINEMVTNFFKHNHNKSAPKSFSLSLTRRDNGTKYLTYRDNGQGFPDGFNIDESNSIGLQLIQTLAEQLDATFSFRNDNGAVYELVATINN